MITTLAEFVDCCAQEFAGNLSGILYYGSTSRVENGPFSDQDLLLTAKLPNFSLLTRLRETIRQIPFFLDLPVIFESEISIDPDDFRLINHGCYFLEVLKRGQVLYGRNVFLDLPRPSDRALRQSVFDTVTEYAHFFRRNFVESNREKSLSVNYQLNRRLIKAAHDLLWLLGTQEENDHLGLAALSKAVPKLLSAREWEFLGDLLDPSKSDRSAANLSDDFSLIRFGIMEKIYFAAQRATHPSL